MIFHIRGFAGFDVGFTQHRNSLSSSDDQIRFFVIPSVTKSELKRRRVGLSVEFTQAGLIMLFEHVDGAEINTEETKVPLVRIKVSQRNARIILHDHVAVIGNKIANGGETAFE